jgi:DNA-binding NtrC family response regulator
MSCILILEDTPALARTLMSALCARYSRFGVRIDWVTTTDEARVFLGETLLLISDYNLVDETTADFLNDEVAGQVPFIFSSACEDPEISQKVRESAVAILKKPLNFPSVYEICDEILARHQYHQEGL